MAMNRNTGLALILIVMGGLILLDKLGLGLGNLISIIFPIGLVVLGWLGIKSGRGVIGWPLIIFGGILLFGQLAGLLGWIIAIALILYGVHMLKNRSTTI